MTSLHPMQAQPYATDSWGTPSDWHTASPSTPSTFAVTPTSASLQSPVPRMDERLDQRPASVTPIPAFYASVTHPFSHYQARPLPIPGQCHSQKRLCIDTRSHLLQHPRFNHQAPVAAHSTPNTPMTSSLSASDLPAVSGMRLSVTRAQSPVHHNSPIIRRPFAPSPTICEDSSMIGEGSLVVPQYLLPMASDGELSSPMSAPIQFQTAQPRSPEAHCRRVRRSEMKTPSADEVVEMPSPSPVSSLLVLPAAPVDDISFASEPSLPELLASVSMVLHVQLLKKHDTPFLQADSETLPEFREFGDVQLQFPSVRDIYGFLLHVFQRGKFSTEIILIALVYVHRAMACARVRLTVDSWRPVLIVAICLAQKMFDDTPLINTDFRILYPQLADRTRPDSKLHFLAVFNALESRMCHLLDWNLTVSTETYCLYLKELQAIWREYDQRKEKREHAQRETVTPPPPSLSSPSSTSPMPSPTMAARQSLKRKVSLSTIRSPELLVPFDHHCYFSRHAPQVSSGTTATRRISNYESPHSGVHGSKAVHRRRHSIAAPPSFTSDRAPIIPTLASGL